MSSFAGESSGHPDHVLSFRTGVQDSERDEDLYQQYAGIDSLETDVVLQGAPEELINFLNLILLFYTLYEKCAIL